VYSPSNNEKEALSNGTYLPRSVPLMRERRPGMVEMHQGCSGSTFRGNACQLNWKSLLLRLWSAIGIADEVLSWEYGILKPGVSGKCASDQFMDCFSCSIRRTIVKTGGIQMLRYNEPSKSGYR